MALLPVAGTAHGAAQWAEKYSALLSEGLMGGGVLDRERAGRAIEGSARRLFGGGEAPALEKLLSEASRVVGQEAKAYRRKIAALEEALGRMERAHLNDVIEIKDVLDLHKKEAGESGGTRSLMGNTITLIDRLANKVLERNGVEEVPAGQRLFDPNVHEAVGMAEHRDGHATEAAECVEEVRKGYTRGGALIRPARVLVGSNGWDPKQKLQDRANKYK